MFGVVLAPSAHPKAQLSSAFNACYTAWHMIFLLLCSHSAFWQEAFQLKPLA